MKLFVDNLTVIDCSYMHPEYGVEGESWICDVMLSGGLDSQSMVMDFGHVKKRLKAEIDRVVDHCLVVPKRSGCISEIKEMDNSIYLEWKSRDGSIVKHQSPDNALCFIDNEEVNAQAVEQFLQHELMKSVNETVENIKVTLRNENITSPYYHYSHGLKKHDGNCQRIAHGHRSKIEIFKNDALDEALMTKWAGRWRHIYIGSKEDVVGEYEKDGRAYFHFAYEADQGRFELEIPQDRCDIIETDSTVECLAEHIAQTLKAQDPQSTYCVKAYEGVQKGAIVEI